MSPRWLVGIIGAVLVVAALIVGTYQPSVSDQGYAVQCGTFRHPVSDAAHHRDMQSSIQYGSLAATDLAGKCEQKLEPITFLFYGLLCVGAVTLFGALGVRTRRRESS